MKYRFLAIFAAATLLLTTLSAGPVSAGTDDRGIGPDQPEIDLSIDGGWSDTQSGLAARPFIKLALWEGEEIVSATEPGNEDFNGNWRVLVSPANVCHEGQEPAPGVCYADPNRIGISLAYIVNGDTKNDFDGPSLSNLGIDQSTYFEIQVDLNGYADQLGWTWVNGNPAYWKVENGVATIRLTPASMPSTSGIDNHCSTIPVSTCDTNQAEDEIFGIQMVMSFDDTLNEVFDHTMFASSDAVIASLEAAPGFDPASPDANSITYGMAAPHLFSDGSDRIGTLRAFLSTQALAAFGIEDPSDSDTGFSVTRTSSDSGSFTPGWSTWTEEVHGTAGALLTISNVTFSVPKFTVSNGNQVKRNVVPKVKINKSRVTKKLLVDLGILASNESIPKKAKITITVKAASKKICKATKTGIQGLKKGTCKYSIKIKVGNQSTNKSGSFKVIK
jgi:hypothetical protein